MVVNEVTIIVFTAGAESYRETTDKILLNLKNEEREEHVLVFDIHLQ